MTNRLPSAALAIGILALAAHAQPPVRIPEEEEQEDAYRPNEYLRFGPAYILRGRPGATDNLLTQVNIGPSGQNIFGDAANEPTLAIDPTAPNRLTIGWRQFDTVSSNFRQAGKAWSNDGGRTWHNTGVLTPGTFRSDPVMDADLSGGFKYVNLTNDLLSWSFVSPDSGRTWSGPFAAFGADKEWIVIDKTSGPGRGFIHQSWQIQGPYGATPYTRSTDGGLTWMNPVPVPGPPVFGNMAVGPNGEVYTVGIILNSGAFNIAKSTNANNAAVTPTFTTTQVNMGGTFNIPAVPDPNPVGLEGQVYVGVDTSGGPRNGWVYMVATAYAGADDPEDIFFARSTDGGTTWSPPIRVNNDAAAPNHYQWFGTLSVAPNGRIDVVFNDTRDSLAYNINRVYYAWSNDGGFTWLGNTPLTGPYDCTIGWPNQMKIGDYWTLISDRVGASLAFAATFNGEEDVFFLRINDWDCNGNGVPDSVDIATGALRDCNANAIPDECESAAGVSVSCSCYANCDASTAPPILNVNDFQCFLNRFAAQDAYANCDASTASPVLNANDFQCFLNRFAAGCS